VNNKYRSYFLILFTFALAACSKEAPQETSAESVTPALNSLEQGLATINRFLPMTRAWVA
jgi:outer membrane biogenesis lipoprotein LolB